MRFSEVPGVVFDELTAFTRIEPIEMMEMDGRMISLLMFKKSGAIVGYLECDSSTGQYAYLKFWKADIGKEFNPFFFLANNPNPCFEIIAGRMYGDKDDPEKGNETIENIEVQYHSSPPQHFVAFALNDKFYKFIKRVEIMIRVIVSCNTPPELPVWSRFFKRNYLD
ncbi:MAG: hypothetical protein A3D44_02775 [Candidatus Staskawiczbacteria bacterium RIFCSPHIGHO2_02_FULL_42_22]|uniref:Uncharacterized protein n=1 Tax=Candidatus Staskawiczbacteria bacterium RIFCSPHIGHO2_02_FULL_42_22 TaxID=1802207 RepID=A0A1G2I400_9BACT|nr:MAG: hypothetical protein A3D44_02775 [Candidatus Staskawiczbacteria bacterium RIFCSPHIGHO2_02_FULL_42_22]